MKTDQLLYFLETSKTQHIGKAAKTLNISPSAISHSIAALESELGQPLFEKVGKNIYLTAQGKRLATRAEEVLGLLGEIKNELQSDEIEFEGKFRIGGTHGLLHHWIAPSWGRFNKEFSKAEVEFYSLRSAQVVEQVSNGQLDLGICFSPTANPSIVQKNLRTEQLKIAVRPRHPILKLKDTQLAAALSESACAAPKAFQGIEVCEDHPALKKAGIKSNASFVFDSYDVAAKMVLDSDLWALVPECFIQWYGLKSVPVPEFKAEAVIASITPKGRPLPRALGKFIQILN